MESQRYRLLPYCAVTIPVILYFAPLVIIGRAPIDFGYDMALYFYPLTMAGMSQWHAGQVPLWTSNIQTGYPLLADGQGALLYPPNLLAYWVLPGPSANNAVIFLQTLLSAVLMFVLARRLGLLQLPAVLCSWIWVASGVFVCQSTPQLNAVTWWPLLVLLAIDVAANRRSWIGVAAVGLVSGIMWLGGFPQMALYGVVLASFFFLYSVFQNSPLGKVGFRSRLWSLSKASVLWTFGNVLGLGIAAAQLLPTLEMSEFSVRAGGADFVLASQASLFPSGLLGYLTPGWNVAGYLSAPVYVGIVALAVAFLTLRRDMKSLDKFLWVVCIITLLLAFGKYTPLYSLALKLPGLSSLRGPLRFTLLTTFCLSLLAGRGFSYLNTSIVTASVTGQVLKVLQTRLAIVVGLLATVILVGGVGLQLAREQILALAARFVQGSLFGTRFHLYGWDYYEKKISTIFSQIVQVLSPTNPLNLQPILIGLLALATLWWFRRRANERGNVFPTLVPSLLILLMGFDLVGLVGAPWARLSSDSLLKPPEIAGEIRRTSGLTQETPNRVYDLFTENDEAYSQEYLRSLPPNYNLLFDIPHSGAYAALGSARYFDLLGPLGGVNLAYGTPPSSPEILEENLPVLNLIGARYVVSRRPLLEPSFTALNGSPPYLYLNAGALPRSFLVPKTTIVESGEVLQMLRSSEFNPLEEAIIETNADVIIAAARECSNAKVTVYGSSHVKIETRGTGWLVLTDLYYPGWHASIDGVETRIYRADFVFRAIAVTEPGDHVISFVYEPDSFRYGVTVTGASFLLSVALVVVGFLTRKEAA